MDCDVVENGHSKLFNSHIKIARRKSIIGMLEDIRSYVMTRNYTLWKECEHWKSEICPNVWKVLELHKKIQRCWKCNRIFNIDDYDANIFWMFSWMLLIRDRTYDELTDAKKIRESCDIKATNIVQQGLPQDIYNMATIQDGKVTVQSVQEHRHKGNEDTVTIGQASQDLVTTATFQTDDLDAFDSDCDEAPSTSAILMAKLSSYDSDVMSEVPIHDNYLDNYVNDQIVQEIQYYEKSHFNNKTNVDITSDSNIISYEQYLKETTNPVVQNTNSFAQQDALIMSMIEEISNQVAKLPRLKMHAKQNDPITNEKNVNIRPVDYAALNRLSGHFVKNFMPQKQLSMKQAFWLSISKPVSEISPVQPEPVLKEISRELPTISLVKDSFNKMRSYVNDFENAITVRTKVTGQNEGSWSYTNEQKQKVKSAEPRTSSSNTQKQVDTYKTKDTNKLLLPSTGVISSTSASGLKPPGNTKKHRITRPTSSNKKNKVEDYLRSVKYSLNKKNHLSEPVCNANVKHSVLNANYELICAACNECMFDAIHDLCVLDYVNNVNVRVKSKSVNSKKKKVWKPTEAVATACYTQNSSLIQRRYNKTSYEIIHVFVNRESAQDVYFKRRIIAVTELQIMEWHDYKCNAPLRKEDVKS
nr:hypothetical protein [Tanacetum cinerariifolium]